MNPKDILAAWGIGWALFGALGIAWGCVSAWRQQREDGR